MALSPLQIDELLKARIALFVSVPVGIVSFQWILLNEQINQRPSKMGHPMGLSWEAERRGRERGKDVALGVGGLPKPTVFQSLFS